MIRLPPEEGHPGLLEGLLGYQLRRASAVMMADLAATLSDLDLRPTEATILLLIGESPGVTQSEIGRILAIKRANMVPLTAGLTAMGLIERGGSDGRSQPLRLTDLGKTTVLACRQRIAAHEGRFLPDLTAEQKTWMIETLSRIWANDEV